MEISIQQLLSSHCQELNQRWLETSAQLDARKFDYETLKPFLDTFREAEKEGYSFEPVFCPLILIDKAEPNPEIDLGMMESPAWEDVKIIGQMKEQSKHNKWVQIDAPLNRLRIEKIKSIAGEFLQRYARAHGPFFLSKDPSTLLVYCNMGSIGHEISLISVLQSKSIEDEKSKSR